MYARRLLAPLCALPLALAAGCDSPTSGGGDAADVTIRLGVSGPSFNRVAAPGGGPLRALTLTGSNGTLAIDDVRIVVAEFELKGDDDVNPCERNGGGDDCEDFDAGPLFVDLPLDGGVVPVSTGAVPPGTYREVEFEVEDLDDDEEDASEAARIDALFQQIRGAFPDWPRDASMLVVGTFTPAGGGASRPFRVFIEAEIEIEVPLVPSLVITDASQDAQVTVDLDLGAVFRSGGGVVDLSQYNGQLVEFELDDGFEGSSSGSGGDDDDDSGPGGDD